MDDDCRDTKSWQETPGFPPNIWETCSKWPKVLENLGLNMPISLASLVSLVRTNSCGTILFLQAQELLEASITLESSLRDHKDGWISGSKMHGFSMPKWRTSSNTIFNWDIIGILPVWWECPTGASQISVSYKSLQPYLFFNKFRKYCILGPPIAI